MSDIGGNQGGKARIHALWVLEGLSAVDTQTALQALRDPHPRVREHAAHVAEELAPASKEIAGTLLAMTSDPDPGVQFQLAFTLGQMSGPAVTASPFPSAAVSSASQGPQL